MSRRRVSLLCALISALCAAPLFAQEQAETPLSLTRFAAGYTCGVEWLGSHDGRRTPALDVDGPWQGRGAMTAEQQLAEKIIRSWWPEHIADRKAAAILDGVARYLQTCAIERVFDFFYLRTAHSVETRPYFGGHVVWSFPTLRLSRHAIATQDRYAAVFESLDRWLGTPALQSALYQVAHIPDDRLTGDTIVRTMSGAVGQDLSWAFDAADEDVSYAVTELTPTSVTVARQGSGTFTGRTAGRVGEFDSGDALQLKTVFADRSSTMVTWDGRDTSRTFTFQGPAPVVAAYLDPNNLVTLDRNRLDNSIVPPSPTNVPVGKWVARWVVWLQHTIVSYGFLA
jgi:hypothetical protein